MDLSLVGSNRSVRVLALIPMTRPQILKIDKIHAAVTIEIPSLFLILGSAGGIFPIQMELLAPKSWATATYGDGVPSSTTDNIF